MSDVKAGATLTTMINQDINEAVERGLTTSDLFCVLGGQVEVMLDRLPEEYRQKVWNEFKRVVTAHTGLI